MRFWRSIVLLALALGLLARPAAAQQSADSAKATPKVQVDAPVTVTPAVQPTKAERVKHDPVPQRRAWMFGFNYGYGGARFVNAGGPMVGERRTDTPVENPELTVGLPDWVGTDVETSAALQYRVGYAVNPALMIGFERAQWFKDFGDYSWRFSTSTLSATWYPGASHAYFRGGAGFSSLAEKIAATGPVFTQFSDRGFSLEGAVGYEWDFWKRLTIAPELSLRHMQYGDNVRAQLGFASLGLNWWF